MTIGKLRYVANVPGRIKTVFYRRLLAEQYIQDNGGGQLVTERLADEGEDPDTSASFQFWDFVAAETIQGANRCGS